MPGLDPRRALLVEAAQAPRPPTEALGYLLRRLHADYRLYWSDRHPSQPAPPFVQSAMLMTVRARPGVSQSDLARALEVERAALMPHLDRLEAAGLIRRGPNPGDRRLHALALTEAGRAAARTAETFLAEIEEHFLGRLSPADRVAIRDLLGGL